ncbi:MAG: HAD family hydrolase [bacterium]
MKNVKKIKAVFFDRDGTLIKDVSYLSCLGQIEFIESALSVCKIVQELGYIIIVVTNQSGVARGYFDEAFVKKTHAHLHELMQERGIIVHAWYYCPHYPVQTNQVQINQAAQGLVYIKECLCRKPKSGMLLTAAQDFNIDLSRSIMIGDKDIDIQAGCAAGCRAYDVNNLFGLSDRALRDLLSEKEEPKI